MTASRGRVLLLTPLIGTREGIVCMYPCDLISSVQLLKVQIPFGIHLLILHVMNLFHLFLPMQKKILSRRYDDLVSLETPVPHYDGRQWRKYGQKHINKAKHPRYLFYFFVVNLLTLCCTYICMYSDYLFV
jgi:hypothetical protein